MSKTAKKAPAKSRQEGNPAQGLWGLAHDHKDRYQEEMLKVMKLLKSVNPGDAYYENYLGMIEKYGPEFFDTYHLIRAIGEHMAPKRILEIGVRTGISLCQLLVAHMDFDAIESVTCVDPFDQWTSPNLVRANLRKLGIEDRGIHILAMRSEDFFKHRSNQASDGKLSPSFDYILVDGDHAKPAARIDLEAAHLLLEKGGIIVFDDISTNDGECGLITEWDDFLKKHGSEYFSCARMEGKGVAWAIKK